MNTPEDTVSTETEYASNGLENFGVEGEQELDLFNSNNESSNHSDLLSSENKESAIEDDDLEIPAFLRRQKN